MAILAAGMLMLAAALEPTPDVSAAAEQAGVDVVDLEGALNTTGEPDPVRYLRHAGHLPWPVVQPTIPTIWDRLAGCESTSRWNANTGNGYFGGVQMDMTFWRRHGGLAYAARPDLASREAQIEVAIRGLAVQGWGAWPTCSRRMGLR